MEATSSYWVRLANDLTRLNYPVSVVNPASAYYFARSVLKRDKTDAMDAVMLAEMAAVMGERLSVYTEPPPIYEALRERLLQRDALIRAKVQTCNRKHAYSAHAAHKRIQHSNEHRHSSSCSKSRYERLSRNWTTCARVMMNGRFQPDVYERSTA